MDAAVAPLSPHLEPLEPRLLLSAMEYLPGLVGPADFTDQCRGQVIYLDFDGAQDVAYDGPVTVEGIDVPALAPADAALAGAVTRAVADVLGPLGVQVTAAQPTGGDYSTIYIGGSDAAFADYGSFLGLSEAVDAGNLDRTDEAFVFAGKLDGPPAERALSIAYIAAHEAGHLLGLAHDEAAPAEAGVLADVAYRDATHQFIALQAVEFYRQHYGTLELEDDSGLGQTYLGDPDAADDDGHAIDYVTLAQFMGDDFLEGVYEEATDGLQLRHWTAGGDGIELMRGIDVEAGDVVLDASRVSAEFHIIDPLHDLQYYSGYESAELMWNQAVENYLAGDKPVAYYYLGRAAHIIADLAVPSHTHLDRGGTDDYSSYENGVRNASVYEQYAVGPPGYGYAEYLWYPSYLYYNPQGEYLGPYGEIFLAADDPADPNPNERLESLFRLTADYTEDWRSDNELGETPAEYDPSFRKPVRHTISTRVGRDRRDLMPWAIEQTAALLRLFYVAVDTTAPDVRIVNFDSNAPNNPTVVTSPSIMVLAEAADTQSGADRDGYVFEYRQRAPGGAWSAWQTMPDPEGDNVAWFAGRNGYTYGFRATCADAVGNAATSLPVYVEVGARQGADLSLANRQWLDLRPNLDPGGDGDGAIEAGEQLRVRTQLASALGAKGVDALLYTTHPGVRIVDPHLCFADFTAGESQWSTSWFDVATDFTTTQTVDFTLQVTYELGGVQYYQDFTISRLFRAQGVRAAAFAAPSGSGPILDTVADIYFRNDGDGVFECGERAFLRPVLENIGTANAAMVWVQIYYSGAGANPVTVSTSSPTASEWLLYPDLAQGETGQPLLDRTFWVETRNYNFSGTVDMGVRVKWADYNNWDGTTEGYVEFPDVFQLTVRPSAFIETVPWSWDFGRVLPGTDVVQTVRVQNPGALPTTVTGVVTSHPCIDLSATSFTIPAGSFFDVTVTLHTDDPAFFDPSGITVADCSVDFTTPAAVRRTTSHPNSNRFTITGSVAPDIPVMAASPATAADDPDISYRWIVWEDIRNGNKDIYAFDLYTSTEVQVTSDLSDQVHPRVSGDLVFWTDFRNDPTGEDIYGDIYAYDLVQGGAPWLYIGDEWDPWVDERLLGAYYDPVNYTVYVAYTQDYYRFPEDPSSVRLDVDDLRLRREDLFWGWGWSWVEDDSLTNFVYDPLDPHLPLSHAFFEFADFGDGLLVWTEVDLEWHAGTDTWRYLADSYRAMKMRIWLEDPNVAPDDRGLDWADEELDIDGDGTPDGVFAFVPHPVQMTYVHHELEVEDEDDGEGAVFGDVEGLLAPCSAAIIKTGDDQYVDRVGLRQEGIDVRAWDVNENLSPYTGYDAVWTWEFTGIPTDPGDPTGELVQRAFAPSPYVYPLIDPRVPVHYGRDALGMSRDWIVYDRGSEDGLWVHDMTTGADYQLLGDKGWAEDVRMDGRAAAWIAWDHVTGAGTVYYAFFDMPDIALFPSGINLPRSRTEGSALPGSMVIKNLSPAAVQVSDPLVEGDMRLAFWFYDGDPAAGGESLYAGPIVVIGYVGIPGDGELTLNLRFPNGPYVLYAPVLESLDPAAWENYYFAVRLEELRYLQVIEGAGDDDDELVEWWFPLPDQPQNNMTTHGFLNWDSDTEGPAYSIFRTKDAGGDDAYPGEDEPLTMWWHESGSGGLAWDDVLIEGERYGLTGAYYTTELGEYIPGVHEYLLSGEDADHSPARSQLNGTFFVETSEEITIFYGGQRILDGQAEPIDLGGLAPGDPANPKLFIIRNDGEQPIVLEDLIVPAGWVYNGPADMLVPAGGATYFTLGFPVGTPGRVEGDVALISSDLDEGVFNFTAFGTTSGQTLDGSTLYVYGTGGDDVFGFVAGEAGVADHEVTVNGDTQYYDPLLVDTFWFYGRDGNDTAVLTGTADDEEAELYPTWGTLVRTGAYGVNLQDMETIDIDGGGGDDLATLYDSAGGDQFHAKPDEAWMQDGGYLNTVRNFNQVTGNATADGGLDQAFFYDSPGGDEYFGRPGTSWMTDGVYLTIANSFDRATADASNGGLDKAYLQDSAGYDKFYGRPTYSYIRGTGYYNRADFFDEVYVDAVNGGSQDRAYLYDSPGNDRLDAGPDKSTMAGPGFSYEATSFDRTYAYATAGGANDRAYLYDSPGSDKFYGKPTYAILRGTGFYLRANRFDRTYAYGTAGGANDRAYLYGSAGNDLYYGTPDYGYMKNSDYYNRAVAFDRYFGFLNNGGTDTAKLYDTPMRDDFLGSGSLARLWRTDYRHQVRLTSPSSDRLYLYQKRGGTPNRITLRTPLRYRFYKRWY